MTDTRIPTAVDIDTAVIEWLLDSDPSIRWQVMHDLTDEPADGVAAERDRVAREGWGKRLLDLQGPEGTWAGPGLFPEWTSTAWTLVLLRDFGAEPDAPAMRSAIERVRESGRWEHAGQPFFEGEVEPCINGKTIALGAYFGQAVTPIVSRLLGEQMEDRGWNCEQENGSIRGSFDTTISVLEGLLEYERRMGDSAESRAARERGHEYLLDRRMFRRLSTGEIVDPDYLRFSHPGYYFYDVLRGLDYLRAADVKPDSRVDEAIELVRSKADTSGRWALENTHPGKVWFDMDEGDARPSRWNTLRALRVLRWYEAGRA